MYGAPPPPPGQFGITSAPGMQRPGMGGISPGGFPAQGGIPARPAPQAPAFAPPVPSMGQVPGYVNALQGNPPAAPGGERGAFQMRPALPEGYTPVPGQRANSQPMFNLQMPAGGWGNFDINAFRAWMDTRPMARDYRSDTGFDSTGFRTALDGWLGSSPWGGLGGGVQGQPAPAAPMSQPITNPTMPGMVGSSYNVGGMVPGQSGFQLPTYNIGG